ncbi:hypothetical protein MXB_747, partial [Myxobolus squamalis]
MNHFSSEKIPIFITGAFILYGSLKACAALYNCYMYSDSENSIVECSQKADENLKIIKNTLKKYRNQKLSDSRLVNGYTNS